MSLERLEEQEISYIDATPIGEDLFVGKSQDRIASAISKLIQGNHVSSGLIGLEGRWGSGKSNVICMIKTKLKETHHLFIYDAWGHQEDLHRRSFLEELTDDLCNKRTIEDQNKWEDKLRNLLARKREVVTRTIPTLSIGLVATFLIAITTPIFKSFSEWLHEPKYAVVITAIPVLAGLLFWAIASIVNKRIYRAEEVYSLFKEHELSKETNETISEKEPSVKEFRSWMEDLANDLKNKDLVIVFDNMDRLPKQRVLELWSSIHTFFSSGSFKKIWAIVPYDLDHLVNIFENNRETTNQFLAKSFPITFRVSPPILTDWKNYFDIKFKEAFSDTQDDELPLARKVFGLLSQEITPRSIIGFINEMVSLRMIADEDIKLRYVALFSLTKEKLSMNPAINIINGDYLGPSSMLFGDDELLFDSISSLLFNVPIASASQVLLYKEIQNALMNNGSLGLRDLARHPHFIEILDQVVSDGAYDIRYAVTAMLSLYEDNDLEIDPGLLTHIWDGLSDGFRNAEIKELVFTSDQKEVLILCSYEKKIALVKHLVKGFTILENFNGSDYFYTLNSLQLTLNENDIPIKIYDMVSRRIVNPTTFIEYLHEAEDSYEDFKLTCRKKDLDEYVSTEIPSETSKLVPLQHLRSEFDRSPWLERIGEAIEDGEIDANNYESFFFFYKIISKEKPLKNKISDQLIHTLLNQAARDSNGYYDLVSMRLSRANNFTNFNPPGISATILNDTSDNLVKNVAKQIEYFTDYGDLLLLLPIWPNSLLSLVASELTATSAGSSRMAITSVLENYEDIFSRLDVSIDSFQERLDGWQKYAKENITKDNVAEIVASPLFFEHAINNHLEISTHIINCMIENLGTINKDDWKEALSDQSSYYYKVLHHLLTGERIKSMPDNAIIAYKEILVSVSKGELEPLSDYFDLFYQKTHKGKLKPTMKNIRDVFTKSGVSPSMFMTFSQMLLDHADLLGRSADVTRTILTSIIDDNDCMDFILDNKDYFIDVINSAKDDAEDFKDKVRLKCESSERQDLHDFARAINI